MNDVTIDTQDLGPELLTGTVGTDFLTFAVGGGANVEAQADYLADPQRPTGNLPGIARSNFNNKAVRQGTFVAHSLCLWMSQQILEYIPDDGDDIKWIGEWSNALSQYILALIPPGPNLGAYLPLAGGTMSGNIQFQSGVSTVLANNTWYFAKDTGGTNRGLIIKASDNHVYINDGSSVYVYFNGIPSTNNNISWSGKDTTGTARSVIGLLSDNAVHVGSGTAGNIYLDTTAAGSVYFAGGAAHVNNSYIAWRDTGGTYRNSIGMNATNQLLIGSGVTGTTEIYAGGSLNINLHNPTVALGLLTVNAYTYMNGGGRCYIPGAHDPFQVYSDNGFYARIHYVVGGTRDWTAGCTNAGLYSIADESAHAVRWEIDLSGHVHAYNNLYVSGHQLLTGGLTCSGFYDTGSGQVNSGFTVYNSLNVASGNLTVSGGTYAYNGLTVYNSINIASGRLDVAGAAAIGGGLTVYNSLNMASGQMWINGRLDVYNVCAADQLEVHGCSSIYNNGGNQMACAGNIYFWNGQVRANNMYVDGQFNSNTVYSNFIQSNGNALVAGHLDINDYIWVNGITYSRGGLQVWNGSWTQGDVVSYNNTYPWPNNAQYCGVCSHQWWAVFSANGVINESDPAIKRDIAPMREICLDLVNAIRPSTFKFKAEIGTQPEHPGSDPEEHPLKRRTHWGFMYPDVAKAVEERDLDFAGAFEDMGSGFLVYNELTAVLWQAVRELSAKLDQLESRLP
jgi:hypothetical protein